MAEIKRGKLKMTEGLQMVGASDTGHGIIIDQLPEVGGLNQGPQPMELLLLALASCTSMDIISIMKKKRQKLTDFEVEFEAERTEEHPRVYRWIKLKFIFKGKNLSSEAAERSIYLSQTKYCPISAMLSKTVKIETSYEIVEA